MYLWGVAAPNGAGSQPGATKSLAGPVVVAHGAPERDNNPQWCGLTLPGDGESRPAGGRIS